MADNSLLVPWEEKRKELQELTGNEELLANAWEMGENFIFLYVMFLSIF